MALAVEMDAREIKKLSKMLDLIAKHGGNVDKPLKEIGVYMLLQTERTYRDAGRGGVKWAPLSINTFKIRNSLEKRSGKRRSKKRLSRQRARAVSSPLYNASFRWLVDSAGVSNKGKVPAHSRVDGQKVERRLRLFLPSSEKGRLGAIHHHGVPRGKFKVFGRVAGYLPARPILFFVNKDRKEAIKRFTKHANEVAKEATHKSGLRR